MHTPYIDVEALLAPIPGSNPGGEPLETTDLFDEIEEARREDDDLPQGEWTAKRKRADWPRVITLTSTALQTRSKDLRLAGWLAEALVRHYGVAALSDALCFLRELQSRFWDAFYPQQEAEDLHARSEVWLDLSETLALALRSSQEGPSFSDPAPLFASLERAQAEYGQLVQLMQIRFGPHAPHLRELKSALDDIYNTIGAQHGAREPHGVPGGAAETAKKNDALPSVSIVDNETLTPVPEWASVSAPQTRAEALFYLDTVEHFFRRTEPHSPVAYAVALAKRWAGQKLEEWLAEVIKQDSMLADVRERLGLPKGKGKSSD